MKDFTKFLLILILIALIVYLLTSIGIHYEEEVQYNIYKNKVTILEDSLKRVIIKTDSLVYDLNNRIDSLENLRNNITIVYEKNEKDFADIGIITDDSIILYISKKIHN